MMSHLWKLLLYRIWCTRLVILVPDLVTEVEEEGKGVDAEGHGDVDHGVPCAVQTWNKYEINTKKDGILCTNRVDVIRADRREFQGFRKHDYD